MTNSKTTLKVADSLDYSAADGAREIDLRPAGEINGIDKWVEDGPDVTGANRGTLSYSLTEPQGRAASQRAACKLQYVKPLDATTETPNPGVFNGYLQVYVPNSVTVEEAEQLITQFAHSILQVAPVMAARINFE